jgi:hypothetical protein
VFAEVLTTLTDCSLGTDDQIGAACTFGDDCRFADEFEGHAEQ